MIHSLIAEILSRREHKWNVKGKGMTSPDEDDVQAALDLAATRLYDEPVGTRLEVGGLIIEKRPQGHDVYCFVGTYL